MKDARRNKAKEMAEEFREKHFSECNKTHCLGWDYERVYLQGWTDADSHPDTSDGDEDELISEAELSECERLEKASTRVVGWYPRPHEKVIKGPFNRWFSIESTKNPIHVKDTASEEEDILFVANAMNMHSRLLAEIRRLRARKSQAAEITELERKLDTCSKAMSSVLWIDECRCDEAYTKRGRCAPNTRCGELDPLREALASIQAAPTNPVDETMASGV